LNYLQDGGFATAIDGLHKLLKIINTKI